MVRLSKNNLPPEVLLRLDTLLYTVLDEAKSRVNFTDILNKLLFKTEKIMVAKRLGIIFLLLKGVSTKEISDALRVSTATVLKMGLLIQEEGPLTKQLKTLARKRNTTEIIEDILASLLLRPGIHLGHHKIKWEYEKSKERRKLI